MENSVCLNTPVSAAEGVCSTIAGVFSYVGLFVGSLRARSGVDPVSPAMLAISGAAVSPRGPVGTASPTLATPTLNASSTGMAQSSVG